MTAKDTSSISFTALYTSQVWQRNGLAAPGFDSLKARLFYHVMVPFEFIGGKLTGGNIRTFLLQRHHIIDHILANNIKAHGNIQVLEIACGLSTRGYRIHQQHPHIKYVECDLPDMAGHKRHLLQKLGDLDDNHKVCTLNIFSDEEDGLEALIKREFDPALPLVVITEGLVNYFSLETITPFWQRLQTCMRQFCTATYLTDNYPLLKGHPLTGTMKTFQKMLSAISRSDANFHFDSDDSTRVFFEALGFDEVKVHDPANYYLRLPIPKNRGVPLVRVIEIRTSAGDGQS